MYLHIHQFPEKPQVTGNILETQVLWLNIKYINMSRQTSKLTNIGQTVDFVTEDDHEIQNCHVIFSPQTFEVKSYIVKRSHMCILLWTELPYPLNKNVNWEENKKKNKRKEKARLRKIWRDRTGPELYTFGNISTALSKQRAKKVAKFGKEIKFDAQLIHLPGLWIDQCTSSVYLAYLF